MSKLPANTQKTSLTRPKAKSPRAMRAKKSIWLKSAAKTKSKEPFRTHQALNKWVRPKKR